MEYIEHLVILGLDSLIITFCYSQYRKLKALSTAFSEAQNVTSAKNSLTKELDGKLVVVQGNVKALGHPLKSINSSFAKGVIQRLTIKELLLTRGSYGFWNDRERIVDEKYTVVPFKLQNDEYSITIKCPLEAEYLTLDVVQDRFEPTFSNLIVRFLGYLIGFHQQGFQYTECLLKENTELTGFGQLSISPKNELQLLPPADGLTYVLTTVDPSLFVRKLNSQTRLYKLSLILSSSVAVVVILVAIRKWYNEKQKKKALDNARINRIKSARGKQDDTSVSCIVCYENPREVLILPCAHVCLCSDCVQNIGNQCPVCRQQIQSVTPAYVC